MSYFIHKSVERGKADHGWLKSFHSFSFASYYHPEKTNFGVLRVLNDDTVAPGMGFGTHPHANMEIISIPLEGELEHRDSMGTIQTIKKGDIQVMSAGSGIEHSEYNNSRVNPVKFLQIWIIPNVKNIEPRYGQISIHENEKRNKLKLLIAPQNSQKSELWIHQDVWFYLGNFDENKSINYELKNELNGVYLFVLSGRIKTQDYELLNERDAIGIWKEKTFRFEALENNSEILLMEVPLD